ncbi:MAG: MotA/TolQ/ExbB proton channel family protein [Planctomycetaceae bacterium]|jgi:biopolymer transport protein ExbB/TolQ|nr:MotA/TolQ/ExbB proton channel family protein [Planctomycetaceae bacterium]
MPILTNIFYIISVSLMIPVMLALLFGLVYTLYLSGITVHEFIARMKSKSQRKKFAEALENKDATVSVFDGSGNFEKTLNLILTRSDDSLLINKKIADLESAWRTELQKIADLTKYGPAIGLMGTLIPLGPALVGLAEGDLVTLSNQMVIAFSTTAVGVLISLIALAINSAKKGWYRDDSILLNFAAERLSATQTSKETA